jgi:hypothetical protein
MMIPPHSIDDLLVGEYRASLSTERTPGGLKALRKRGQRVLRHSARSLAQMLAFTQVPTCRTLLSAALACVAVRKPCQGQAAQSMPRAVVL